MGGKASMEPCLFRHGKEVRDLQAIALLVLQWSHVFSDMVRLRIEEEDLDSLPASMEPCLFRHGKLGYCLQLRFTVVSFNGAMSFQTW